MSAAQLQGLIDVRAEVVPLTVEQYHRMIETGILEEGQPIELLDGYLVRKDRGATGSTSMMMGHHHAWVISQLMRLNPEIERQGSHLRLQLPISLPPDSEPEPDGAIVLGQTDRYRERQPGPADVTCIIEVADRSLQHDRTTKLRIYADAGIGQYVIVNLVENVVEEYRQPIIGAGRYDGVKKLQRNELLQLVLNESASLSVPVAHLLP